MVNHRNPDKPVLDLIKNILNDRTAAADKQFRKVISHKVLSVMEDQKIRAGSTFNDK